MNIEEKKQKMADVLSQYIPEKSVSYIVEQVFKHSCFLKIVPKRKSVMGSYQYNYVTKQHIIKINHDLNSYSFLFTLVHELAHLQTFTLFQNKVKPHGEEWQAIFGEMITVILPYFPADIQEAIEEYKKDITASSCTDENLYKTLKKYDSKPTIFLDDIPMHSFFKLENYANTFQKIEKIRKNYKCLDIQTKKMYKMSGLNQVEVVTP